MLLLVALVCQQRDVIHHLFGKSQLARMAHHPIHFFGIPSNTGQIHNAIYHIDAEIERGYFRVTNQLAAQLRPAARSLATSLSDDLSVI